MSKQAEQMLKWGFQTVTAVLFAVIAFVGQGVIEDIGELHDKTDNHEQRLTRREANAFTSQDANQLLLAVTKLTAEVSQHRKEIDNLDSASDELLTHMRNLKSRLTVAPADVLRGLSQQIEQLRKDLKTQ